MAERSRIAPAPDDRSAGRVSTTVVTAVAGITGVEPTDLPPLYDVVDPGALDRLFGSQSPAPTRDGGRVTFSYAGCTVVVSGADRVRVTRTDACSDRGAAAESATGSGLR